MAEFQPVIKTFAIKSIADHQVGEEMGKGKITYLDLDPLPVARVCETVVKVGTNCVDCSAFDSCGLARLQKPTS
jgi:hypothetical protein